MVVAAHAMTELVKNIDEVSLRTEILDKVTKAIVDVGFEHADHMADTPPTPH